MYRTLFISLFILLPIVSKAQMSIKRTRFNGFIDTYHAVNNYQDFLSSRTRFRGEFKIGNSKSYLFTSFNLTHNNLLKDETGIKLLEAFYSYKAKNINLKIGRQIIIWGVADGLRITDKVSPMDYTEFLARDYDDIRLAVDAFKFRYTKDNMKLDFVFIPIFESFNLPINKDNPWSIINPKLLNKYEVVDNKPKFKLDNSELGIRLSYNLPGIDFSLSSLYTWNKIPIIRASKVQDKMMIIKDYKRMFFIGGDISKPMGEFVIRGEGAINFKKAFLTKTNNILRKKSLEYLLGIDWYASNEWVFMCQYSNQTILDYNKSMVCDKNMSLLTLNITKKIFNSTTKLSDFTYYDINNNSSFSRFSIDYSLSDQLHFIAGYDCFIGDKGKFGLYKDNSEYWLKAKYTF